MSFSDANGSALSELFFGQAAKPDFLPVRANRRHNIECKGESAAAIFKRHHRCGALAAPREETTSIPRAKVLPK